MANPNFYPETSTNSIYRDQNTNRCLTDDLDTIEADIAALETGKADSDHTHTPESIGAASEYHYHSDYADSMHTHDEYAAYDHTHDYAETDHTHTPESIGAATADHSHAGYATSDHTHDYAETDHTHTPASIGAATADHSHTGYAASTHTHSEYAESDHTHTPESIGAAAASHSHDYAASSHTHAQTEITGLVDALSAKVDVSALSAKADLVDGKIPSSQLPGYVDDVLEYTALANFPTAGESGKIYVDSATNKTYRWTGSAYVEISASLALGETASTAYRGDRGKIAYDHSQNGSVHVTEAQKTAWDNKAAGTHSHSYNDLSDKPTIPAAYNHPVSHPASMITGLADVATSGSYNDLSDKPTIPDAYSHPSSHPASMITGLADVATSGSYNDLSDKPSIPTSLPANGGNADTVDSKHASDFATATHTHSAATTSAAGLMSAADKVKLDGIATGANKITVDGSLSSTSTNPVQNKVINSALAGKAASSHSHSYNDLSDKPTIPSAYTHPTSHPASMITGLADVATSGSYNDLSDKPSIPTIPASLPANGGNADTVDGKHASDFATASHSHNYAASSHTHVQGDIAGLVDALSAKANVSELSSKADLVNGKIPTSQLPAYVDDVLEYAALSNFPATGEAGKIYVATGTNKTYRWSGSAYVEISASLALGETSATAYRGDRGKIAYDHSQNGSIHVTAAQKTAWDSKAAGDHSHSYNDLSDKPTIPTIPASLPANGGNADTVDNKHASDFATASHTHAAATTSAAGLMSAADKTKLDGIATGANKITVDSALSSTSTNPVQNKVINTALAGKAASSHSHSYNDLTNKPTIPAAYTHPSYTAKSSGLYKVTVDSTGHVSAATAVTKADITALGIPGSDTNTTYSAATTSAAGLMSAADKTKLDGIATGANKITVDSALSSSSTNPVQNKVINTALAGKAATSHNHDSAYMAKALQFTADNGGVEYSYNTSDGKNVLTEIAALPVGAHTVYSQSGVTGNPKTTEAWRFMVHKTGTSVGWVMAYGSAGSVYSNYVDGNGWKGWRAIYDANPEPLWSGTSYLSSSNGTPQTVTPKKKLSECRTGWLLLWSDQDPGVGPNDSDFCTTVIPKYTPSGGTWGGKAFYCDIPMYVGSDTDNLSTEKRCIKPIYVHDNKIAGSYQNTSAGRNDVVLRAIYEI